MAATVELNIARRKLGDVLGDNVKSYFTALKLWFRCKISKADFDMEARQMIPLENIHLHNEFLLAVLNKCQTWTSAHASKEANSSTQTMSSKDRMKKGKAKKKSRPIRATFEHRFQPLNPLHCVPPVMSTTNAVAQPSKEVLASSSPASPSCDDVTRVSLCVREATLPDEAMVYGRMFVTAWDYGLDAVDGEAVHVVMTAVHFQLKAVLTALFRRRHAYKLRENRFVFALGSTAALPNPYVIGGERRDDPTTDSFATDVTSMGEHVPSIRWTTEIAEAEAARALAASSFSPSTGPASLFDLHEALQAYRGTIPSHSVYAVNMERIAAALFHPSHEDLEQEELYRREQEARHDALTISSTHAQNSRTAVPPTLL